MRGVKSFSISVLVASALAFFASIAPMSAFAVDQFIKDKEEGWFWYEREPDLIPEVVKKPVAAPPKAKPTPEAKKADPAKPSALSVEWFQQEYPKILNAAIDDPTEENVRKYRYSTRVMLDKASNFTHVFQREALLDPLLDESVRSPFASAARGGFERLTNE